jgi:hypothetical protein
MLEVYYKKTKCGSFTLFVNIIIERMITVHDLSGILDKSLYEVSGYFQNVYNAEVISGWSHYYLYFKKEKNVKKAVEYINGVILANKMIRD